MRALLCIVLIASAAACTAAPAKQPPPAAAATPEKPPKTPPADAVVSASGLASLVRKQGQGEQRPTLHDEVRVLFTAWNEKGKLVDSSDKRGGPVVFDLGGVIAGWKQALPEMRVGEARRVGFPTSSRIQDGPAIRAACPCSTSSCSRSSRASPMSLRRPISHRRLPMP